MTRENTAVDWLIEKLTCEPSPGYYTINGLNVTEVIQQAKEMEKQQIIDAHINGNQTYTVGDTFENAARKYYNETYGNDKN